MERLLGTFEKDARTIAPLTALATNGNFGKRAPSMAVAVSRKRGPQRAA
jgi:hypothetical protein